MNLFELKNYVLTFAPQTLAIKSFKAIWDRDKSKNKDKAINELSYIYFMTDYRSDFLNTVDEIERHEEIVKSISLPKGWKRDKLIDEAISFYTDKQKSIAFKLLEAAKIGVSKIEQFFRNVNMAETDDKGKPIYNIKQLNDTLKQLGETIEAVEKLEGLVKKQVEAKNTSRGDREKALYEDGIE